LLSQTNVIIGLWAPRSSTPYSFFHDLILLSTTLSSLQADDSVLRAITQLFPNLKICEGGQSSWKASRSIGDSGVQSLCGIRDTLHTVRFPWLTKLSDNAIRMLAFECADRLVNLKVSECAGLSNAAVEAVAKSCNVLETFEFAGCIALNDTALEVISVIHLRIHSFEPWSHVVFIILLLPAGGRTTPPRS